MATSAALLGTLALTGCSVIGGSSSSPTSGSNAGPTAATSTPTTPAPTATTPTSMTASDLVGDWRSDKADWTVHFKSDGTFVEDFQGLKDFRTGTYTVDGETVSLVGGDGDTDKGTINGEVLDFKLGELVRDTAS